MEAECETTRLNPFEMEVFIARMGPGQYVVCQEMPEGWQHGDGCTGVHVDVSALAHRS